LAWWWHVPPHHAVRPGDEDVQRDLVGRLLPVSALHQGDHPVEERLAGFGGDQPDEQVRAGEELDRGDQLPISTTNMTGILIISRGSSFTNDCSSARRRISGSSRAAAGRVRAFGRPSPGDRPHR
jgi:hypothetical protein